MKNNSWKHAEVIIETLEYNGHKAYFVGGCVRDSLLQRPVKDIDITTSALPKEVMEIFTHVIPTGIEHGTVLVRYKHQSFEVTTFRSDGTYTDKRRPDKVRFIPDIKEDLARRDFTINAMAMDREYEVIDLFGGRADIQAGIVNTVGHANKRFKEDALRILRALRFASQLGFTIEAKTCSQMTLLKDEVKHVAIERVKEECEKFFQGEYVQFGMKLLCETELDSVLPIFSSHPELLHNAPRIHTPFASMATVIAFFHYIDQRISVATWVKAWKCSNKERSRANTLSEHLIYYKNYGLDAWLAYQMETVHIEEFCRLTYALFPEKPATTGAIRQQQDVLPVHRRDDIDLNGNVIAALFPKRKKGRWIAEIMEKVEYLIVTKQLENKQSKIKEWIRCHPPDRS